MCKNLVFLDPFFCQQKKLLYIVKTMICISVNGTKSLEVEPFKTTTLQKNITMKKTMPLIAVAAMLALFSFSNPKTVTDPGHLASGQGASAAKMDGMLFSPTTGEQVLLFDLAAGVRHDPDVDNDPEHFAGGSGTEADPWLIETAEHLDNVRHYPGERHDDKHFKQITDIDGNVYQTVTIGEQEWMSENLKVTHYQDGSPIPDGTGIGNVLASHDYYFVYDDDPGHLDTYGLLYTGYVVMDDREVCPSGWTIPTNDQWKVMEMQLGMSWRMANVWGIVGGHGADEGGKLKTTGFDHWQMPNVGATNEFGFSALPGGLKYFMFGGLGTTGLFYTATPVHESLKFRGYDFNHPRTHHTAYGSAGAALSLRCIKIQPDQTVPEVVTGEVSTLGPTHAHIQGTVTGDGNATVVARGIVYGMSPNPIVDTQQNFHFTHDGDGTGSFTGELIDLVPDQTYYARAYAVNATGINYGEEANFMTPTGNVPQLSFNVTIDEVQQTSMQLSASVIDEGDSFVKSRGFVWSESNNPTLHDHYLEAGTGVGEFSGEITGLTPNMIYFIRAYATNDQGTSYSNRTLRRTITDRPPPTVITEKVDQVTTTSAVVIANVVDDGGYEIMERGITVSWDGGYETIVVDGGTGEFSATFTGLEPGTEHFATSYAINENGRKTGGSIEFTTVFDDVDQVFSVLNDMYELMHSFGYMGGHIDFGVKSFDITNDLMGEDMARNYGYGWFMKHYGYISHRDQNDALVIYTWHRYHEIADIANWILAHIDQATGDPEVINSVKGQALAMRAFAHLQLVQVFSHAFAYDPDAPGIPYHTETTRSFSSSVNRSEEQRQKEMGTIIKEGKVDVKDKHPGHRYPYLNENGVFERGKVSDVYDQLQADLDEAVVLFENAAPQEHRSHIDLAVALGLRARVALATEDWDSAAEHAEMAISAAEGQGRALYEAGEYISDNFNTIEGSEWLWGSEIGAEEATGYGSFYSHMDARFMSYASLGGQVLITQELYNAFPGSDVRKNLFIGPGEGAGDLIDYNQMKFLTPEIGSFAGDYLYMRLAEMYLIRAEALARSGQADQGAQQALHEVVSRRDPQYNLSSNTGEALTDEIMLHRRMELWGEGHRSLDIRRLQLPLERPSDDNHNPQWANIFDLPANDEMFVWRIPLHSYLAVEIVGEGNVEVEGQSYVAKVLVANGSEIVLEATAGQDYIFTEWKDEDGQVLSSDPVLHFTIPEEDIVLTANFIADDVAVTDRERTEITLYPNPARSKVNVVTDGGMMEELRVVDMLGQVVYSTFVGDRRHEIGVSGLRPGVYFVQITTADAVQTHRIQVSR